MRLIDADWLQERLAKEPMENRTYLGANEIVVEAPTAYDVDKVVERLKENADFTTGEDGTVIDEHVRLKTAIEIVKSVCIE